MQVHDTLALASVPPGAQAAGCRGATASEAVSPCQLLPWRAPCSASGVLQWGEHGNDVPSSLGAALCPCVLAAAGHGQEMGMRSKDLRL